MLRIKTKHFINTKKGEIMKNLQLIILGLFISSLAFAETHVPEGTIVGETWTRSGSPYIVDGNISVAMLTIEPGVTVLFSGNFKFEVTGILTAVGVPCDSIVFSQESGLGGWKGIKYTNTAPGSEMAYCIIEKSTDHALYIENSTPIIRNCTISNNYYSKNRYAKGGGIYGSGNVTLIDCLISGNTAYSHGTNGSQDSRGGGIYVSGTLNLIRCNIKGNQAKASASWGTGKAYGGGIYVSGTMHIENCFVKGNLSNGGGCSGGMSNGYGYGGGIYVSNNINFKNSVISNNTVAGHNGRTAGGVYFSNSGSSEMINSTVAYNSHQGIYVSGDSLAVKNSIAYFNGGAEVSGKVKATYSDIQNGFVGEGNINYNPVFQSTSDLTIVNGSPCMNSGDPSDEYNDVCFPPSLNGARNDMGAHGGSGACGWLNEPSDIVVDFSSDLTLGTWPLTVQFTDLTIGEPSNWKWDFDNDGIINSYEQNPEWTYTEPGIYTVLLRACDGENQDTEIKTAYITVYEKQLITIPAGWSGISSYIEPNDADIENVFNLIENELVILQNYDGMYWPSANVNTLGSWDSHAGYQVKMETQQDVMITGWMQDDLTVNLNAGWNYLPVLNFCDNSVEDLFSGLTGNLQIVKEIAGGKVYWPTYGVNTLDTLYPGKAYFGLMDEDATLTYPECDGMKASATKNLTGFQNLLCLPWSLPNPSAISHNIAMPVSALKDEQILAGDIIGAFDAEGNCYGATRWNHENTSITLFGDDLLTNEKDGFSEGEELFFKLFCPETENQSELLVEFDPSLANHDGTFRENALSAIKSMTVNSTSVSSAAFSNVNMYPNPAKDILHIDFGMLSNASLQILNLQGQVMLSKQLSGQTKELDISALPAGLYFVQLESEQHRFCRKLIKE